MKTDKLPLSLYIHIPFCKKKCLYCDFLSAPACAREREEYVKALLREISDTADNCKEYKVISIFFGGGTPSLLSAGQMKRITDAVRKGYNLCDDAEITAECNPATATFKKLASYRQCGINRLSIGLQSANDAELKELGRAHNYRQFLDTFASARKAGFTNINVDIMSALPGQTVESYRNTLECVSALAPEHISAYSLIIEENTPFYERYQNAYEDEKTVLASIESITEYPLLPNEDEERRMYHNTVKFLKDKGYSRYEISNYAKKGYECRHNMTYWTGIDYIGLGLGASSYFKGRRYKNTSDVKRYLCDSKTKEEVIILTPKDQMEEYMFLGLRLKKGVSIEAFGQMFHVLMDEVYGAVINRLKADKLLLQKKDRLYLSKKGTDVANYVMSQFILDE